MESEHIMGDASHFFLGLVERAGPAPTNREAMPEDEEPDAYSAPTVFVASTSTIDRADDIVEQDWDLEHFRKNPVILWAHDSRSMPVGRAVGVEVVDGRLMCSVVWDEAHEVGKQVARQVREGFLSAVSVGFYPGMQVPRRSLPEGDPRKADYGYILSKNKLIEISVVPVPANPQALVVSRSLAQSFAPRMILDCWERGLPAPGPNGGEWDAIRRWLEAKAGAEAARALLEDEEALGKIAEAVALRVGKEPAKGPDAPDALTAFFRSAPQDGQANDWSKWFE
jgi:HK97 family phage prohead protease